MRMALSPFPFVPRCVRFSAFLLIIFLTRPLFGAVLPSDVAAVFKNNCAQCHGGTSPESELNLESSAAVTQTIGRSSTQKPDILIIKPGDPSASYLVQKITGASGMSGRRMPPFGTLSQEDAEKITSWITSLDPGQSYNSDTDNKKHAFLGLTAGNTPAAEVLAPGTWFFRISHRFAPAIKEGYDSFYGFDGPAVMMVTFGAAITGRLMMTIGRTNAGDAMEWTARYRIRDGSGHERPCSIAIQTTLGWETAKSPGRDRYSADAVSYSLQLPITRPLPHNSAIALVPGILGNPNPSESDEEPLAVIGLAGRLGLGRGYSIIGDWTPIVSGFASLKSTYGVYDTYRRYDAWSFGVEKVTAGHVFQLFVTNAEGIATAQALNGGDLKLQNGEMRFGFEIYRMFR
jgi:mono/diheme cytochrome c family protein